jgi:HTH-type transcriptional regulator/antitoxin HipB
MYERPRFVLTDAHHEDPMRINSTRDLAATVRGRRRDLKLSQRELALRAQVSREWVNAFEAGKATVEFGHILRILDVLDLVLDLTVREESVATSSIDLDALLDRHRNA